MCVCDMHSEIALGRYRAVDSVQARPVDSVQARHGTVYCGRFRYKFCVRNLLLTASGLGTVYHGRFRYKFCGKKSAFDIEIIKYRDV